MKFAAVSDWISNQAGQALNHEDLKDLEEYIFEVFEVFVVQT